ncbi:ABC transporter permease [Streptomyces inhibens]|uniref:ABC transporter permease n=1 Tax=Streptomyces inhibens TaxID=2293571 RepID=A0A371Q8A6_STRIH|nr:ABC transporter permease [Streptomyces inhibens]REK90925.1 ABC transporter permease [Streptomyces inhibens]
MVRPIARVLLFPFAMAVLLVGIYTAAMHAPTPHHLKIAVAGPPAQTGPLAASLRKGLGDAYDVSTVASVERARQLVAHRAVAAAYVPAPAPGDRAAGTPSTTFAQPPHPSGPVLYTASAAGAAQVNLAAAPFTNAAVQQHQFLQVRDLVPLSTDDTSDTSTMYAAISLTLAGYLSAVMLSTVFGTGLTRRRTVAALAAFGAAAALTVWLITGPILGAVHGFAPAILLTGWLTVMAVGMATVFLSRFCGRMTPLPAVAIFMFLGMPASGAALPIATMPAPIRALHDLLPMTSTSGSLRQIMYFGSDGIGRYWLTLALWALAGLLLTLAYDTLKARRTGHRNDTAAVPRQTSDPAHSH